MEGALPLLSPQTAVKYTAIQVSIPTALIIIPFKLHEFLEVTYCFRKIIKKIIPASHLKTQPSDQSLKNGVNYFSMPLIVGVFKKYPIFDSCK